MVDRRRDNVINGQDTVRTYDPPHTNVVDRETTVITEAVPTAAVAPGATAIDRVRWSSIIAGLFAALTALVVLGVLGLTIGLSSYTAGDPLRNFGIGAGIWGAVSTLIAFFIGGWLAAGTAGIRGRGNGVLNGAMVWIVMIPLLLFFLSNGISSLLGTAGNIATAGVSAMAPAAAAAATQPGAQATAQAAGQNLTNAAQATATAVGAQINPQNAQRVANAAGNTAWGTLIALLIGLVAAVLGGLVGARPIRYQTVPARVNA